MSPVKIAGMAPISEPSANFKPCDRLIMRSGLRDRKHRSTLKLLSVLLSSLVIRFWLKRLMRSQTTTTKKSIWFEPLLRYALCFLSPKMKPEAIMRKQTSSANIKLMIRSIWLSYFDFSESGSIFGSSRIRTMMLKKIVS